MTRMVGASVKPAAMSGERGIKQFVMNFACAKTLSAFDRGDDDLSGAEEHGVNGVEIALEALENLGEWSAEIARSAAGKRLSETLRILGRPRDIELRASAVDDRIIGAAHSGDKVGMRWTERRGAHAVDDARKWKLQLVGLMQRPFQHPRDHLRRPGQALSRSVDHRQSRSRHPAIACDLVHNFPRRRTPAFDDQCGDIGFVPIADVFKNRFLRPQGPSWARAESEKCVLPGPVRQAPPRILTSK